MLGQLEEQTKTQAETALKGAVALVTGGGRGLGEAICETLSQSGVTTIVADVRRELAETVAERLQDLGGKAASLPIDVTQDHLIQKAVEEIVGRYERLDFLINNAGMNVTQSVEALSIQDWDRILAVNLRAPFVLSKTVFPFMKRQGSGAIVNIISTAAKRAWANASAYHASKWGLLGLSHALHVEGRTSNIKVTAVISGGMRTPFLLDPFPNIDLSTLQDPKNVAQTVKFLLTLPRETVIPEMMVLPLHETSWP